MKYFESFKKNKIFTRIKDIRNEKNLCVLRSTSNIIYAFSMAIKTIENIKIFLLKTINQIFLNLI